jgi:hypothetical protein
MMKIIFIILIFCLIFTSGINAQNEICRADLGFCFLLPSGWLLDSTETDRVNLINLDNNSCGIKIIRYDIDPVSQIGSDGELNEAIAGLYKDMGLITAPDQIFEFSIDSGIAIFEQKFTEHYVNNGEYIYKNTRGYIGRRVGGYQTLYLIVVISPENYFETVQGDINLIMQSFRLTDLFAEQLYKKRSITPYLLIFLILALTVFFYSRNRRIQKSNNPLGRDSSNFWRCSNCRKSNHIDKSLCSRCGHPRENRSKIEK